ncbi:MAG: MBL fold metallo-hydrolase [Alphaproteobacteria bacterium]|nr:MAG: MBL fold metallo-hydrolase [Alphaproteobacteria bacterium]
MTSAEPPMKATVIPVTPFQQNCSLIWCTATMKGAFIDPGGDIDQLLTAARHHGVTIEKILVTHGHLDHCGGVADLAERLDVPIEGPQRADDFWIAQLAEQARLFGFGNARPFTPTRWLENGDQVTVGKLVLDVIFCPGHTPGHVVFYHAPSKLAFVGDVLFQGSIGRTDFPRGDFDTLIRSITQGLWPLGKDVRFVPGHGPMSSFGQERASNPFVGDNALAARA